jgi:uncharacterized protein YbaR (Trm112 family)
MLSSRQPIERIPSVFSGDPYDVAGRNLAMTESAKPTGIDADLLEILRCPVGVHLKDKGDDPGRLELVKDCWLVCEETGLKYPIRDGIPVMLVDEGERWKDTPVDDLPVPPPAE